MMAAATVTISSELIHYVRRAYDLALQEIATGQAVRKGVNGFTSQALPAYVI